MKVFIKYISIFTLLSLCTSAVFAVDEDTQIEDKLNAENTKEVSIENFKFKTFNSCDDFEKITGDYLKKYQSKNKYVSRGGPVFMEDDLSQDMLGDLSSESKTVIQKSSTTANAVSGSDFSETNTQVSGVDESDIIKTDGEYIYYMSDYYDQELKTKNYSERQKKYVFIIDADTMQVVKKLKLPKHFWGTQLYLKDDKLVVLASGRPTSTFQKRYWDASSKTYTIIFDVSNPSEAELVKAFMSEGNFAKSRLIDDKLYVISRKNTYNYYSPYAKYIDDTVEIQDGISAGKIIPKGLEIYRTSDEGKQNVDIDGKKLPYNVNTGYVASCNEIEYILPENDTSFNFPSFNLVSIIDIDEVEKEAETKVIFGDLREIYMSLDNLYITNSFYKREAFSCPANARCIVPYFYGGTNHTLIHKLAVKEDDLEYKSSALIPGQALTQYSMDEHDDHFRILTSKWQPERSTGLYILDKDLKLTSSLTGLGKTEDYKSSRFIGDKLFLVTFKQVDPLFAIDLKNPTKPEILGELKIPGYSTYLHPYDENHLIGLGYNTSENKWGGTINDGLKADIYKINYDKKCGDANLSADEKKKCDSGDYKGIIVEQLHSYTFGANGSYSEALSNPRMFMWNAAKKLLLLPATLYKNDSEDIYKKIGFFNGLVALNIDKDAGISEKYRTTQIDTSNLEAERKEECSKYSQKEENQCKELIDGSRYCGPKKYTYIPNYCYADSTLDEYLAAKNWNYSNYFVKRALWVGDTSYAISDKKVTSYDLDSGSLKKSSNLD